MASGLECLPTEEKKFFQIGVKKGERSFLRKTILKLKKRAEFISVRKNGSSKKSRFFFKCRFSLGFKLFKFRSLVDIPPIQSSKTAKDC